MKKLLLRVSLICFLALSVGNMGYAMAQYDYETEAGPDSLSIDDADPLLLSEEEVAAEKECCPAIYIGIALVVVVAGVLVYRSYKKKKA